MLFNDVLKKISPTLRKIVYKLDGRYPFLDHNDLFQEAVIHLWRDFNIGKLVDKTDSYILQGCYFHLKNYLRKVGTNKVIISLDGATPNEERGYDELLALKDPKAEGYLDYLNNKMLAEAIMNNGFSGREKEILSFFRDGLTTREIGKKIGVSHVRVVKLMRRIREKCKRHLDY